MSKAVKHLLLELARNALPIIITIVVAYLESRNDDRRNDYHEESQNSFMMLE